MVKKKWSMLSRKHRKDRMDFAISHKEWTLEDWKRVVWSDETKVNRLGSDGRKWVWKRVGEPLSDRLVQVTKKFGGGSVMVWGCMTWDGVGMACKIDGRMDGELYCQILDDELQGTLAYYHKSPAHILFQQDNDPKHTSKRAQIGSTTMISGSCNGLLSPQTSIQSSICGVMSRRSLGSMKNLLVVFMSCGSSFRRSGRR